MNANLIASLESLRNRYDRGPALILGFSLLLLSWLAAFVFDNDLCIIAAAACAFFCMHVSNAKQSWTDARTAAEIGDTCSGLIRIYVVRRGQYFQCDAEVQVSDTATWRYENVKWAFPCLDHEPCVCYFKPGVVWPVLVVSGNDMVLADHKPCQVETIHQTMLESPATV